ncbi:MULTISPECIES: hypothetical protein [Fusobacterium]|jgi:hypothetical protein|uniref:Uncharacterized protein n=2 Tax=Fusobacterium mortiferum TaxID=850 RepID=A0A414PZ24_FUSMR|nr:MULTISPECIES: hypothetical protein [Fusobacterium]AVQ18533.1 hypothetical protein C4N19_05335 [Fusobacterium mortiferum ATCC 9817]EEO34772.1 hypothetical protein FMAG_00334 [Fusobacterium mortiferum ATCC 9817]MCF2627368.1 hypothetical protein [Fusobacterium mortiferum]MDY4800397.1 hypothetical protein [Fusobacterium mortiferum]MSS60156.1 hypothetical protein [Fusobacterium sp. FSA-380-WT-2B]
MFGFGFGGNGKITKAHVVGAAVGIGVTVAGYYLYKKNKTKVDAFLRNQGINIKSCDSVNYEDMSVEALTETKEHIEDILAERELNGATCEACEIAETK